VKVVCYGGFRAATLVWQPRPGAWVLTVACHAVFELLPDESPRLTEPPPLACTEADEDRAFVEPWGPTAPYKPRPEVLVVGHAYAHPGSAQTSLVARLGVGELEKLVHVHGDAHFTRDGALTATKAFERMPLRWERAAGAPGTTHPAGVVTGRDAVADAEGRVRLPNLRPMGTSLDRRDDTVAPVGFAPTRPTWPGRIDRLHPHAAGWDAARLSDEPVPADFDYAYFNVAPPDQVLEFFSGTELLLLEHLHPSIPRLVTRLAPTLPSVVFTRADTETDVPLVSDTLVIDADLGRAFVVWRGHVPLAQPGEDGVVFVSAARIGTSATGTLAAPSTPVDTLVLGPPEDGSVQTLAMESPPVRPALPFDAGSHDARPIGRMDAPEHDDDDPPTLRRLALKASKT